MGTTKAAIDVECLADAITAAGGDLDAALERYDRARRPFGTRIVARARKLGAYIEAQLKPPADRTEAERQPPPEVLMREIGSMAVDLRRLTAEECAGR
jgi:2-polyprenyl-6-methoxyphenol hydroxylase-like FAD-dependent oxidoreductase